jgi:hypothetical protein
MMETHAIQIIHALPGRVRVRLPRLKGNVSLAAEVERTLTTFAGIHHVKASTTTGSVLVLYEPRLLESLDLEAVGPLMELAGALGLSCEDMDVDRLQDWLHTVMNGTHPGTPTTPGNDMAARLSSAQADVTQVAGEWGELRTLVPLTLAFLGLRSLLLTEQLPFPAWYDYLWFAFSTYMILNLPRPTSG